MDAKHLIFFKRTAELENMTKAAEELLVSQPFLSRVIAELEKELDTELFDRVGRGIKLNQCGQAFYKRVNNIFNEIEDAKKELADIEKSQHTLLTVVTNVSLYMPGLLKALVNNNLGLMIRQLSAKQQKIHRMLQTGEADFAICYPPMEDNDEFETIPLRYEPGVIIYPEGHWLSAYKEISFSEIKDETFISVMNGYGTRAALDIFFQQLGLETKISLETSDTGSVFKYVSNGLGIALMPLSQVLREPYYRNHYTNILDSDNGIVSLTWRRNMYIGDANRLFIEKTKEYFSGL